MASFFCPHCGNQHQPGTEFCPETGLKISIGLPPDQPQPVVYQDRSPAGESFQPAAGLVKEWQKLSPGARTFLLIALLLLAAAIVYFSTNTPLRGDPAPSPLAADPQGKPQAAAESDAPAPTAKPVHTTAPTRTKSPTATKTPDAKGEWEACKGTYDSRLHVDDRAYVSFDPPLSNRVRSEPNRKGKVIGMIEPGEKLEIISGPECADDWVWWKVKSEDTGLTGWTSEGDYEGYWLVPIP